MRSLPSEPAGAPLGRGTWYLFHVSESRTGRLCRLCPGGQVWPTACAYKQSFIDPQPHSCLHAVKGCSHAARVERFWQRPHGPQSLRHLLLLLSGFSRVQLYVTPQTAAHQAPPSLGFSRQEHWRGLPFPSPVCETEK